MLDESIRMIQETEREADARKATHRTVLQHMLTEAEARAAEALSRTEEIIRQERATLLAQAEAQAAAIREEILEEARRECNLLQAQALQNREQALAYILSKGV